MKNKVPVSLQKYATELEKYSNKVSPHFDVEHIHRLRTATKKLRSLLRWQKIDKTILPGSFVKAYHVSGDLRNLQLLLIGLDESKIKLPGFLLWLATSIGRLELDWNKTYQHKAVKKLQQKLSHLKHTALSVKALKRFFDQKIFRMKEIMQQVELPDDSLHDIRKMIKDMLYLREWCKKNWPEGWNATKKISLPQLKKLSELAGNYNDKRTWLLILADYLAEEKDDKAILAAKKVQKSRERERKKLRKDLITALTQFNKRL